MRSTRPITVHERTAICKSQIEPIIKIPGNTWGGSLRKQLSFFAPGPEWRLAWRMFAIHRRKFHTDDENSPHLVTSADWFERQLCIIKSLNMRNSENSHQNKSGVADVLHAKCHSGRERRRTAVFAGYKGGGTRFWSLIRWLTIYQGLVSSATQAIVACATKSWKNCSKAPLAPKRGKVLHNVNISHFYTSIHHTARTTK